MMKTAFDSIIISSAIGMIILIEQVWLYIVLYKLHRQYKPFRCMGGMDDVQKIVKV
jgi:hypothetical protein